MWPKSGPLTYQLWCGITMTPNQKQQMQKRSVQKRMAIIFIRKLIFAILGIVIPIRIVWDSTKSGMALTWKKSNSVVK